MQTQEVEFELYGLGACVSFGESTACGRALWHV